MSSTPVATPTPTALQLDDVQAACVHGRPNPYTGAFVVLRIDDRAQGRVLMRRLAEVVDTAADVVDPSLDPTVSVGVTAEGLRALGVGEESIATFASEFVAGMASRRDELGDHGDSDPDRWESPWRPGDGAHVVVVLLAPTQEGFETARAAALAVLDGLPGVQRIWHQDVGADEFGRNSFGFADGISQPSIEGSGVPPSNPHERPLRPGEFVTGYPTETDDVSAVPQPVELGRNGSYLAIRKLYTDVAGFRRFLHGQAADEDEEQMLAAKIMGRWPSGAPLVLAPDADDPAIGADAGRNNAFGYAGDPDGLSCPVGSHARRMNARDAVVTGDVRLHRLLRRSATYGPPLGDGVRVDDGVDRGLILAALFAQPARQFEFVQKQWIGDGRFIGAPTESDPLVGGREGGSGFTIPRQPIRKHLTDLPAFVVNRGGEYFFVPSLTALRWLGEPTDAPV